MDKNEPYRMRYAAKTANNTRTLMGVSTKTLAISSAVGCGICRIPEDEEHSANVFKIEDRDGDRIHRPIFMAKFFSPSHQ